MSNVDVTCPTNTLVLGYYDSKYYLEGITVPRDPMDGGTRLLWRGLPSALSTLATAQKLPICPHLECTANCSDVCHALAPWGGSSRDSIPLSNANANNLWWGKEYRISKHRGRRQTWFHFQLLRDVRLNICKKEVTLPNLLCYFKNRN